MNTEMLQQMWIATVEMATEVRRAGFTVNEAFNLLRSAKVILSEHSLVEDAKGEYFQKANELIESAQRLLFSAVEPLGKEFVKKWDEKFKKVMKGKKIGEFLMSKSSTFYSGLPRGKNWVRISIEGPLEDNIEKIIERSGATLKKHDKEHVLIIGDKTSLRKALDEISPYLKVKK